MDIDELKSKIDSLKRNGKVVVFTNGCFDILHAGHIEILEKAKSFGDVLVVGLNSDESVRELKGKGRPINSEDDRLRVLSAIEFVDFIVTFSEPTPFETIRKLRPDILVKGEDYSLNQIVGRNIVESYGGRVELIKLIGGKSTSEIIKRIKLLDIE